jgi:hypothetical protein
MTGRRRVVGRVEPKTISPPDSEVLCPRVARLSSGSGRTASPCNHSRPKVEPHSDARRLGNSDGAWATERRRQCDEAMGF